MLIIRFIKINSSILSAIIGLSIGLIVSSCSMSSMVNREIDSMISEAKKAEIRTFYYKDLEGLPSPVQRQQLWDRSTHKGKSHLMGLNTPSRSC